MEDVNKMLEEQQKELERIRNGKKSFANKDKVRKVLNVIFLFLALVGFGMYFTDSYRDIGIYTIMVGMLVKIVEFFIRFMF